MEEELMRAIAMTVLLIGVAAAVPACKKNASEQNVVISNNIMDNADIEALPPDESSETPTNELTTGDDNADVGDLNTADNSY
jgi:hypothetical protein